LPSGFTNNVIQSYALHGNYFFDQAFKNLWAGGGFEYWKGSIDNSDDFSTSKYTNYILTLGTGFILKIWNGIYVSPSGSIHLVVAGDRVVDVGNETFEGNTIIPDISVRIGYHFPLARRGRH
jgi:hypothetical protein